MKSIKKIDSNLPAHGREVLSALRSNWEKVRVTRSVYKRDDNGNPQIVEIEIEAASPIRRLNAGVPAEAFYQYAEKVKPEDKERVLALIEQGTFEVAKALSAEQAPIFAADKKQTPTTWKQAINAGTASIATLRKYKGEEKATNLVFLLLKSFALKFGKRNDLTEEGLRELSEDIVAQFPRFTIAEVKYILRAALKKRVKFDKVFNLDYQTMIAMFDEALVERLEYSGEQAIEKHNLTTGSEKEYRPRDIGHGLTLKQMLKQK